MTTGFNMACATSEESKKEWEDMLKQIDNFCKGKVK